ncbi:MAG: endo-1,4-beta-xylanase [Planctomycetota bacterium]|jgi:endo-1,4-beta-xylanase|nr:endo-1,4-beta-xylanase [Planctomycetota bacterium]
MRCVLLLCLVTLIAALEMPPGGEVALAPNATWIGNAPVVAVAGQAFSKAHRVVSTQQGLFYQVQHGTPLSVAVRKGDVVAVSFWARCEAVEDETGMGLAHVYLQRNGEPWNKPLLQSVPLPATWTQFAVAGKSDDNYGPGEMALMFGLGTSRQTVQIADVQVLNYADRIALKDLPINRPSYPGRGADAAWRAPAAERIRSLRMAPLEVEVVDVTGVPVANVPVAIVQTRHAFPFGSAFTARHLTGDSDNAAIYRAKAVELFNAGTLENGLKWGAWDNQWGTEHFGRDKALAALRWCQDNNLAMRGHVFVWPSKRHLPNAVKAALAAGDAAAVRAACDAHIDDLAAATKGLLHEWDVVNEPYSNHDIMDLCGPEVMLDWFARAREHLPGVALALNDYGILTAHKDDEHQAHFETTLRYLLDNGAPIDVIGMQGHFGGSPTGPERILAVLDRFAALGLKIRITEFDIDTGDEELQADFTRDFLTAVFSHEAVIGVQFWGFWSGAHWRKRAALYDQDWNERPNGRAYRELVHDSWNTTATLTTDAQGRVKIEGFMGAYTVTAGDKVVPMTLSAASPVLRVVLPQ